MESRRLAPIRRAPISDLRVVIPGILFVALLFARIPTLYDWGVSAVLLVMIGFPVWWVLLLLLRATRRAFVLASLRRYRVPWKTPHPWNRRILTDDTDRSRIAWTVATLLLVGVGVQLWMDPPGGPFTAVGPPLMFFLPAGATATLAGYHWVRRLRYGVRKVILADFPAFVGEEMRFRFIGGRALASAVEVKLLVECLDGTYHVARDDQGRKRRVLTTTSVCHGWRVADLDAEGTAEVSVPLPAEAPGTSLIPEVSRAGIGWQLEVRAEMPGVDYHGLFLLPIYERPRVSSAAGTSARSSGWQPHR